MRAADAVHGPLIPANMRLAEAELMLAGKIGREVTLRNALRDLKREKDLILIDCPPTLGLLTVNALVAADHAILSTGRSTSRSRASSRRWRWSTSRATPSTPSSTCWGSC